MKGCLESSEGFKTTVQFGTIFTPLRLNDVEPRCSHQALLVVSDLNVTRPKLRRPSCVPFWREGETAIPVLQSGANIYYKDFQFSLLRPRCSRPVKNEALLLTARKNPRIRSLRSRWSQARSLEIFYSSSPVAHDSDKHDLCSPMREKYIHPTPNEEGQLRLRAGSTCRTYALMPTVPSDLHLPPSSAPCRSPARLH